jgi:hypothetical protein
MPSSPHEALIEMFRQRPSLAALPAAARSYLEATVKTSTYEYQSDFVRNFVFQGRAEGEALALFVVLEARGIEVPEDARSRIKACTDVDQLNIWLRRAVAATSIDDLFA